MCAKQHLSSYIASSQYPGVRNRENCECLCVWCRVCWRLYELSATGAVKMALSWCGRITAACLQTRHTHTGLYNGETKAPSLRRQPEVCSGAVWCKYKEHMFTQTHFCVLKYIQTFVNLNYLEIIERTLIVTHTVWLLNSCWRAGSGVFLRAGPQGARAS